MIGTAYGIPLTPEDAELNNPAMDYNYGYPVMEKRPTLSDYLRHHFHHFFSGPAMEYNYGYPAMEKRTASRPTLSDYLRLAAIQYEMDKEEDEAADAQNAAETLAEASPSVDKRGRRYGFWVTAINKMGGGNLKSFLGKHKNIYNVYKRNRAPMATGNVV